MRLPLLLMVLLLFYPVSIAQDQDGSLPHCTLEDFEHLAQFKSDYDPFNRLGYRAVSRDLLRTLVEQQYEWRRGLNDGLPHCTEAFEIGWLMSQVSGDIVAAAGLTMADQQASRILAPATRTRLEMEELFESLQDSLEPAEDSPAPAVAEEVNLACSDGQLEVLAPTILLGFQEIMEMGLVVDTLQDYFTYFYTQNKWRDDLWQMLPKCREAVEYGLLMNQIAGEFLSMYALKMAGISDDENPSVDHVFEDTDRLGTLREELIAALDRNITVKTYFVVAGGRVNIRSCGSTSCAVIGVFDRGEELRVIDDSGDWYQIRLSDGRSGFIAGFLAGADPP